MYIRIPPSQLPELDAFGDEKTAVIREETPLLVKGWVTEHDCVFAVQETTETLKLYPQHAASQKALSDLRKGKLSGPRRIIAAFSGRYHQTKLDIHPDDASVYIAPVTTKKSRLNAAATRVCNVMNRQRLRISNALRRLAGMPQIIDPDPVPFEDPTLVAIPYVGTSSRLSLRSKFDNLNSEGSEKEDKRMALVQVANVAGGATHVGHTAVVGYYRGDPCILGQRKIILPDGPTGLIHFPSLTRIAILPYDRTPPRLHRYMETVSIGAVSTEQLNCHVGAEGKLLLDPKFIADVREVLLNGADTEVLFIADAPGDHDTTFPSSKAGKYWMHLTDDFIGQHAEIRMENIHPEPKHPSNHKSITESGLQSMKDRILFSDAFICILGRGPWDIFCRYFFTDEDAPLKNHPFFVPVAITLFGWKRIVILVPHPGVTNHIGHIPWVFRAYSHAIPLILIIASHTMRCKKANPGSKDITANVLARCNATPQYLNLVDALGGPSQRPLWSGPVTSVVQSVLDQGMEWSTMNAKVAEIFQRTVIRSFKLPTKDTSVRDNLICIIAANKDKTGGDPNICVDARIPGSSYTRREYLVIPNSMRPFPDPFYGYAYLHPKTLALQFMSTAGKLYRNREDSVITISRPHYKVSASYIPGALEEDAKDQGIFRPLLEWEEREYQFRKDQKQQDIRFVNTLSEQEILDAVADGRANCVLHPLQESYKFMLWDEGSQTYDRMHPTAPWVVSQFEKHKAPKGFDFVAPFVQKVNGYWGFLLFAYEDDRDLEPKFVRRSAMIGPLSGSRKSWIWTWGNVTYLYKVSFQIYVSGRLVSHIFSENHESCYMSLSSIVSRLSLGVQVSPHVCNCASNMTTLLFASL